MSSDKIYFMQFTTKNSPVIDLDIGYANKLISKVYDTKFLGIYSYVDSTLPWKFTLNKLHKLSAACYEMRSVKPFMSQETLKMVLQCLFSFRYELWIYIVGVLFT